MDRPCGAGYGRGGQGDRGALASRSPRSVLCASQWLPGREAWTTRSRTLTHHSPVDTRSSESSAAVAWPPCTAPAICATTARSLSRSSIQSSALQRASSGSRERYATSLDCSTRTTCPCSTRASTRGRFSTSSHASTGSHCGGGSSARGSSRSRKRCGLRARSPMPWIMRTDGASSTGTSSPRTCYWTKGAPLSRTLEWRGPSRARRGNHKRQRGWSSGHPRTCRPSRRVATTSSMGGATSTRWHACCTRCSPAPRRSREQRRAPPSRGGLPSRRPRFARTETCRRGSTARFVARCPQCRRIGFLTSTRSRRRSKPRNLRRARRQRPWPR